MNTTPDLVRPWRLLVTLTAIVILGLMGATRSHAEDGGFYGGRSLTPGISTPLPVDKGQLAVEPGSVALAAAATRLDGERIFGGYRFGPGFAVEGARTRFGTPALAQGGETLSMAGVSSLPLTDSVTLVAKLGLHYPEASGPGSNLSFSELAGAGVLYGLGLSLQLADNVELRARSERFAHPQGRSQGTTADTFLFGANVRF
jgi:hypothetical protein